MPTVDEFLDAPSATSADAFLDAGAPPAKAAAAPAMDYSPVNMLDPDAGLVRSGRDFESLRAQYGPDFAARSLSGQAEKLPPPGDQLSALPWYEMEWGKFRHSRTGRALFGPTDDEKAAIASGEMPGPPGNQPGLLPIALSAPNPFLPSTETTAGKVLLGAFIAQNLHSQPERIAAINDKFQMGDAKGAWHDMLGDLLETGMVAAGAHDLHGELSKGFESGPQRAARIIGENVDAADLGPLEPFAQAGGAPVNPELDAVLRQGYQLARTDNVLRLPGVPGLAGQPPEPGPTVPETPAEPERNLTVTDEIRAKKATTIKQIQDLYPKAQLNREQARELRNAAWGKQAEASVPKTADEFLDSEPEAEAPKTAAAPAAPEANPAAKLPPVKEGFVRMFHGGADPRGELNGPRDITPYYDYAAGYARKSGAPVWYVDVPHDAPYMKKAFEEFEGGTRAPYINTTAPAEVIKNAKLAEAPKEQPTPRGQQPGPNYKWNPNDPLDEGLPPGPITTVKSLGEAERAGKPVTNKAGATLAKPTNLPEQIRYSIRPNGKFDIAAVTSGEGTLGMEGNLTYEQLAAKVGKPIADLIAANKGELLSQDQHGYRTGVLNTRTLGEKLNANESAKPKGKAPKAKPVEKPAEAAAKVQEHVQDVAQTEGQRPAKEVKSELVDRLGKAIAEAPARADLTSEQQEAFGKVGTEILAAEGPQRAQYPHGAAGLKAFDEARNKFTRDVRAKEVATAEKTGLKRITIDIPGDGKFTVWNVKETLGEVLKRARGLDTSTTQPKGYKDNGISKEDADWVRAETAKQTAQTEPKNTYFIQSDKGWKPVAGKSVTIPGFEGIEFFAHTPPGGGKGYKITEATTGLGAGGTYESSVKKAVEDLVSRFKNTGVTPEKIRSLVEDAPKSPRVTGEALAAEDVTPRGSGAKIRTRPAQEASAPVAEPVKPDKINAVVRDLNRLRANVAPQTFDKPSRYVGNLLRMLNAKLANEMLRADESLKPFRTHFDRTPVPKDWVYDSEQPLPHNLAFVDAYENGRLSQLPEVERRAAEEFRRQNEGWLDRVHALGTGALQTFYENYFPHLWEDPVAAKAVFAKLMAKRPLEGPKSFLRQRTHQLFEEGLKAGLRPVHDNPVDLWLLKKREVERYILARNFINDTKAAGLLKFVHAFAGKPEGYSKVDDGAFTQWGPPTVPITEYFDAAQRAGLEELLRYIGASQKRLAVLPHKGAIGLAYPPPIKANLMKAGADESTAWHELGHQMDWKFPELRERLGTLGGGKMAQQLRNLVDLRGEGQQVSEYRKKYFRETEEKIAEIFKAYIGSPELFRKTAPLVWDELNTWLGEHPDIKDRVDAVTPRLAHGAETTELPVNGLVKLGDWMLPDAAARVVNNYLSPGLNPHLWFRSFREASNLLNGAQLGLSAFHLGFTSLDAATSRLALGIEDAAHGDIARAMRTVASVPFSPVTNIMLGAKVRAEVMKPGTQPEDIQQLARALEQAGGRVGQDRFWRTEFTRRMIRSIHEGTASGYLKGTLQAPFALLEQTMRPIMEYVVPRQKLGVFADMARREIERLGPDATPDEVREAMRKAWDSVDNRMGQLVYDNLFYNRWVKDLALMSFRAYGWQLGKYREGIGAAIDTGRFAKAAATGKPAEFTHRMAYAMALPLMIGTLGAIATYLMTGRKPEGMDYFMPPTGETDDHGNPVRLNFPSYMKDVLSYGKHPVTSFQHSLNPMFGGMMDLYENKDFYNVEIRHPDDPLWKQGSEVAQFAAKQFIPFSVSGAAKLRDDASPMQKQVLPFFGITPAPARMTMTPAQELASDLTAGGMGDLPRTQEQFDKSKIIREAVRSMKTGKGDGSKVFADAIATGKLRPDATEALMDKLKYSPLQFQVFHLDANAAMKVWRVANAHERGDLQPLIVTKILNAKSLSPDEKQGLLKELTQ